MKGLAACVLFVFFAVGPAGGQVREDTTQRTITFPVPENGIIYIRSGKPGGVRIRSRHAPQPATPQAATPRPGPSPDRVDEVDLDRLASVFDRQGLNLYGERVRLGDRVVIVLRDSLTGAPADTLLPAEVDALVESFGGQPPREPAAGEAQPPGAAQAPPGPLADTALVRRVERSILDVGLFRSVQVNFEFDRSELLPSAFPTLDAVADVLRRYPDVRLEVAGHTDAVGSESYNQTLSSSRAASVRDYLVTRGVDDARLRIVGYGESAPILSNATETGRALNRRVEFRVIGETGAEISN